MPLFMKFTPNRWRHTSNSTLDTFSISIPNACPKNRIHLYSVSPPPFKPTSKAHAFPEATLQAAVHPPPYVSMHGSLGRGVTFKARRPTQEDRHVVWEGVVQNVSTGIYGVFDGHSGPRAAEYCQQGLLSVLLNHETWNSRNPDVKSALRNAVERLEAGILSLTRAKGTYDGTTLCVVVIHGRKGWFCNVGDSRCVLLKKSGVYVQLSHDHLVKDPAEKGRLIQAGCVVRRNRLMGNIKNLEVSRALGNREFKEGKSGGSGLISAPEVGEFRIGGDDVSVMVATDALWDIDILGNDGVCEMASAEGDVGVVAGGVVREALRWRNGDNVSLVLVRLHTEWGIVQRGERGAEPVDGFSVGKKDIGKGRGVYWEGEVCGSASRGLARGMRWFAGGRSR